AGGPGSGRDGGVTGAAGAALWGESRRNRPFGWVGSTAGAAAAAPAVFIWERSVSGSLPVSAAAGSPLVQIQAAAGGGHLGGVSLRGAGVRLRPEPALDDLIGAEVVVLVGRLAVVQDVVEPDRRGEELALGVELVRVFVGLVRQDPGQLPLPLAPLDAVGDRV